MSKKSVGGRPALYSPKNGKVQVRFITAKGAGILDKVRRVMKTVAKWPGKVTDSDVVDYLARCWKDGEHAAELELKPKATKEQS